MRAVEVAVAAVFLALCAIGGIYLANRDHPIVAPPAIGVLRFEGQIDFETATQLTNLIDAARQDGRVAGVVLELLSPGGYATSSESLFYSLLKLRQQKPVVVVIDGLAASGGYYMAAAGNRIFAPASAYIGNVGARGGRPEDPALAPDELSTGPYKLEGGSRFEQIHQLDLVARSFVQNVAGQRQASPVNPLKLTPQELGEARLYLGSEALALGLIDAEGGRTDGIEAAAALAGLQNYAVVQLPEFLNLPAPAAPANVETALQAMLRQAPPGAIYLLDSRIALPVAGDAGKRTGDAVLRGQSQPYTWSEALGLPAPLPTTASTP